MYDYHNINIATPVTITEPEEFFLRPAHPKQRQYEALRAFYVEGLPSHQAARNFGYTPGAFRVLCYQFRHAGEPRFFLTTRTGPRSQPKKSAARELIFSLRKQNHSVYDISEILKERKLPLSPTAVGEVLRAEGFAPLPRRRDDERPRRPRASIEVVADVRAFSLGSRRLATQCGGLFLFLPDLARLHTERLTTTAHLPGSKMIPAAAAFRASLALKLWSLPRKSHVMALAADEGLALFAGLNATPKKSFLSEYSCRITPRQTQQLVAAWHAATTSDALLTGDSFNLDFHSIPYHGHDPQVESHYVSARSRRQPSILVFLAQNEENHTFCYANADLRKGEEGEEIFAFLKFWQRAHRQLPKQLVFDSKLTTHAGLARLAEMGIDFITLRRRSPRLLKEVYGLPRSAWRTVELDVPSRQYRFPRVFEQNVSLLGHSFRQLFITDLGHEQPTILLTNQARTSAAKLITRYARRMLIENSISDAVRFFHVDALSSAVGLKVDFDMALLVIASGLYRLLAREMRGYSDAQARQVFRDLVDLPADVEITDREVRVEFHRRAHLPIVLASKLCQQSPVAIPWWDNKSLRLTTYEGPPAKSTAKST
jgi:transposase